MASIADEDAVAAEDHPIAADEAAADDFFLNEAGAAEEAVLLEESGFVRIAICRSVDSDQL